MFKRILLLAVLTAFVTLNGFSQTDNSAIPGTWQGILKVSGFDLHIVFNVSDTTGTLSTTMDSPDQNAYGITVDSTLFRNDSVYFGIPPIKGFFDGVLQGDSIAGTWHQGGNAWPLVLKKTEKVEKPERTQTPQKP